MKEIELKNKRQRREKQFLQEDGSVILKLYNEDIHFKKNDRYEEIDNTLILKGNSYINKANNYQVIFNRDNNTNELYEIKKDNYYISFSLKNIKNKKVVKKRTSSSLKYLNALKDGDIEYLVQNHKIKENIILKKKNNNLEEISFYLKTNLDLSFKDGKINAYLEENNIFSLDAPYMIDKNNNKSLGVSYELLKKEDFYELKIKLDRSWLLDSKRSYPVIIDPTITVNENNEVFDTYIYPGDTNVNRNSFDILKVGVERIDNQDIVNRALLKFNLPVIGTGSQIESAIVHLVEYPYFLGGRVHGLISVHRLTSSFDESTANWENMHDKYDPIIEDTFYGGRSYMTGSGEVNDPSITEFNITNLVKKWSSGTPNYGVMLKMYDEVYMGEEFPAFFSKDNVVTGDNPAPFLEIKYRNQNGLEEYLSYHEQSLNNGKVYINEYNGNLTSLFQVGYTLGSSNNISLYMVYNTNDVITSFDLSYGLGLRFNFHQMIKETTIDNVLYFEYIDEDGTSHFFKEIDGIYKDEDNLHLTINKVGDNYYLNTKDNSKLYFIKSNNIWLLKEIIDNENKKIILEYDDNKRLIKVTDISGNIINIVYANNKITIKNIDKDIILNYSNNKLTSITGSNSTTSILYNENNLIKKIIDTDGRSYTYEYYSSPFKVSKITEYGIDDVEGESIGFEYNFDSTTITDNKDRTTTLTFNSYGNVENATSLKKGSSLKKAYGKYYGWGSTSQNKNQLLKEDPTIGYVKNYLTNTSFEADDLLFTLDENINYSFSNTFSKTGNRSLKLESLTDNKELYQNISLEKGNTYTFSCYLINEKKVTIKLSYTNSLNEIVEASTNVDYSNSLFNRYKVSLNYEEDALSDLKISFIMKEAGYLYIDDIQLEEGEVANYYNLIENSDFSNGLTGYQATAKKANQSEITYLPDRFEVISLDSTSKALKIKSDPNIEISLKKTFNINGKQGDTYQLSFWYKNQGINSTFAGNFNVAIGNFNYVNSDTYGTEPFISKPFHPNNENWQYFTCNFVAEFDYNDVILNILSLQNANNLYITNLCLFKDLKNTIYEYDDNGNLTLNKKTDSEEDKFKYDNNNSLIKLTDPRGGNLTFEYDNKVSDRLLSGISKTGISNEYNYDSYGNVTSGKIINRYSPELNDGLYQIRLKGTKKYLKNDFVNNKLILTENVCSNDEFILEKGVSSYKIKTNITNEYITYQDNQIILSKNNANNLFNIQKNDNNSYSIRTCDDSKALTLIDDALSFTNIDLTDYRQQFYFENSRNSEFIYNSASYSEDGKRLISTTDTLFNKTLYDIDSTGLTKKVTFPNGDFVNYTYNNSRQITKITKNNKTALYTYNNQKLLSSINKDGVVYNFEYDEFLNRKKIKIGNDLTLVSNQYEEKNGNLLSYTYGNNHTINHTYDEFDRISKIIKMNDTYNYTYNNLGKLAQIKSRSSLISYDYDFALRTNRYRYNDFYIFYTYDKNNVVSKKHYKLKEKELINEYTYNLDNLVTNNKFLNNNVSYEYDDLGRISSKKINNNYTTKFKYKKKGKRTSLLLENIENNNHKYSYTYDKSSNITKIYDNNILINNYYYDLDDQLIKEDNYPTNETIKYKYDKNGNILSKTYYKLGTDEFIKKDNYCYDNSLYKDQLTKFNDKEITYDGLGNPLTIGNNVSLTWTNGDQLQKYQDSNNTILYEYDVDGIRTKKTLNNVETTYYTENDKILIEKTGSNILYFLRDGNGELLGFKYNDTLYYYIQNAQGDIIDILDSNYNEVVTYQYDSFGNILSITDTTNNQIGNINPFRYRGYYYDKETNLYYLNSRYYNPVWGRFVNLDGILGTDSDILSYNLYAYCKNNPIKHCDTTGKFAITATLGGSLLAGGLAAVAKSLLATTLKVAATALLAYVTAKAVKSIAETGTKSKPKKETPPKEENKHYVYMLVDYSQRKSEDEKGITMYVGRTNDLEATKRRHRNNPARMHLKLEVLQGPVSYEVARGAEEFYIWYYYDTLRKGNPANNQIHGISLKNPRRQFFLDSFYEYMGSSGMEHEIYVYK